VTTQEPTDAASSPTATPAPSAERGPRRLGRPRAGRSKGAHTRLSATWTAVVVAVVVLIFLVIFIAQNTQSAEVNYLGAHGHASTAVVILIAALAGAIIVIVVAGARLLQVRRRARRTSQIAAASPSVPVSSAPVSDDAAEPSPSTATRPIGPAEDASDLG
jgi:uncharacterized integral membrane protein